jgi:RNA polymerase sigma-70 factor, ECF subfamily
MLLRDTPNDDPLLAENKDARLVSIVKRAQTGDREALACLFDLFNAKICTYLVRLVHDESVARDLAQNTFLKALQQLPTLNNPARFKAWIYKIAKNEANEHRRCTRPTEPLPSEEEYNMPQHLIGDGPEKQVEDAESLEEALGELSPQHYNCLILYYRGYSQRDIARFMGMSEKNVSVSISRARELCRQRIRPTKGE